jgi:murein DD-endopeptidase MepM/ murein hydrolase activator NlpD
MKESRLIHYRASDFQEQLKKPTTVARPTTSTSLKPTGVATSTTQGLNPEVNSMFNYSERQSGTQAAAAAQNAYRATYNDDGTLATTPFSVPTQGLQAGATEERILDSFGWDLSRATAQAEKERVETGTVSPETQSAIDILNNPSLLDTIKSVQGGTGATYQQAGTIQTQRATAGAPLTSPQAGAMGRAGAQGFNPASSTRQGISPTAVKDAGDAAYNQVKQNYENLARQGSSIDMQGAEKEANDARTAAMTAKKAEQDAKIAVYQATQDEKKTAAGANITTAPTPEDKGYDMSSFDTALGEWQGLMDSVKNLDPSVQGIVSAQIIARKNAADNAKILAAQLIADLPSRAEIEASGNIEKTALYEREKRFEDMVQKNQDIALEAETINKQALELDKQMMLHKAAESEQEQLSANAKNEKKLRRQLNALGIETDLKGLEYLDDSIQEGLKMLQNIRESTSIMTAKYDLEIGQRYANNVKSIMANSEANLLTIHSNTDDKIDSINKAVSLSKSERDKEYRKILSDAAEAENKAWTETADKLFEAQKESNEIIRNNLADTQDKKQTAYDNMFDIFMKFPAGSPQRQYAVDEASKSGIDVTNWDINTLTTDQINKKKTEESNSDLLDSFGQFLDAETGFDFVEGIANAAIGQGGTEGERAEQKAIMLKHLREGKVDMYENQLFRTATNSLNKELSVEEGSITSGAIAYNQIQNIIETYNSFTEEQKNSVNSILGKKLVDVNKWVNNPNNADLIDFVGRVGYFVAAKRKQLFGASLTGNEKVSAKDFLPNAREQSLDDTMTQISGLQNEVKNELNTKYGLKLGNNEYAEKLLNKYIYNTGNDEFNRSNNVDSVFNDSVNGTTLMINGEVKTFDIPQNEPDVSAIKVGDSVTSPLISGKVTTIHDQGSDWKYGVDIAPTSGRGIYANDDVEVVNIIDGFENTTGKPLQNGSSQNHGFGNVVVLRYPNGNIAYVSHIEGGSFRVKKGDTIKAGTLIANAGNTGLTYGNTGVHVDYTLGKSGIDPFKMPHEQTAFLYGNEEAAKFIGLQKSA